MLTEREQQILDLLRRDPLMGSDALAAALGAYVATETDMRADDALLVLNP